MHAEEQFGAYVCEVKATNGACPEAYLKEAFQGSCYMTYEEKLDQKGAQAKCKKTATGAHLATISTKAENEKVFEMCGQRTCLIGLSRSTGSSDWYWMTSTRRTMKKSDFQAWADGRPQGSCEGKKDCKELTAVVIGNYDYGGSKALQGALGMVVGVLMLCLAGYNLATGKTLGGCGKPSYDRDTQGGCYWMNTLSCGIFGLAAIIWGIISLTGSL